MREQLHNCLPSTHTSQLHGFQMIKCEEKRSMQCFSKHWSASCPHQGAASLTLCLHNNLQMRVAWMQITAATTTTVSSSPGVELSKPSWTNKQQRRGLAIGPREAPVNARLSLCSLVSGFINKHSLLLLSTTEIPPSPISADDSLQLLKSGRRGWGGGCWWVLSISQWSSAPGSVYPFPSVFPWAKHHSLTGLLFN